MPKTKDAFALRDFDAERILQRRWFKELDLPIGTDEAVLLSLNNVYEKPVAGITPSGFLKILSFNDEGYLEGMLENLDKITRLADRAGKYSDFIYRHMIRLDKVRNVFIKKVMSTEDTTWSDFFVKILSDRTYKEKFIKMVSTKENTIYKEKISRTSKLIKKYSNFFDVADALRSKAYAREEMLKNLQKNYYTKIFAKRLREARKAAGLTQAELAAQIGIKRSSYGLYEQARNEPNVSLFAILSQKLNRNPNWFLGF